MTGFKIVISFSRVFLLFLLFDCQYLTEATSYPCDSGACCSNWQAYDCSYQPYNGKMYCGQGSVSIDNGVCTTDGPCQACHLPTTAPTFKPTMPTMKPTTFQPTLSHSPTVKPTK